MTESLHDEDYRFAHDDGATTGDADDRKGFWGSGEAGLEPEVGNEAWAGDAIDDAADVTSSWLSLSRSVDGGMSHARSVADARELESLYPKTRGGRVMVRGPVETLPPEEEYDYYESVDAGDAASGSFGYAAATIEHQDPVSDGLEVGLDEPLTPEEDDRPTHDDRYLPDDVYIEQNPYEVALREERQSPRRPRRKLWELDEQVWLDVEFEPIVDDEVVEPSPEESVEEPVPSEEAPSEGYEEPGNGYLYDSLEEDLLDVDEPLDFDEYYGEPDDVPYEAEEPRLEPLDQAPPFDEPLGDEMDDAYLLDDDEPLYEEPASEELPLDESPVEEELLAEDELQADEELQAEGEPFTEEESTQRDSDEEQVPERHSEDYEGDLTVLDRIKHMSKRTRVIVGASTAVVILLTIYIVGVVQLSGRFLPNTHIGECDVSELTVEQAEEALTERTKTYALTISVGEFSTSVDGASVSLDRDEARIAREAYQNQSPFSWPIVVVFGGEPDVDQGITYDNVKFDQQVTDAVDEYNQKNLPTTKARVAYNSATQTYSLEGSVDGQALDKKQVLDAAHGSIAIMRSSARPNPDQAFRQAEVKDLPQYATSVSNANAVRDATIPILVDGKQVSICDQILIRSWVSVTDEPAVKVDEDAVESWCKDTLSPLVYKEGEWGEVFLDIDAFVDAFAEKLRNGDSRPFEAITYDELNREGTSRQQAYEESPWHKELGKRGRYIDVDLAAQFARLFDSSGKVIWESAFVSGDMYEGHQTITGTYELYAHLPGQVLVGLDYNNDGKPDYESYVNFWMPFYGGYGLHDATWRDSFGGDLYVYNGSHGCINLPYEKAEELYNMTSVGDTVYVHE